MNSVLRWAGSKRKLLPSIRARMPISFSQYLEPFAGSAVLFFDIAPRRAVLGDLNPEVIATYAAVRDAPDEVTRYLCTLPADRDTYYRVRSLDPLTLNQEQRAARLIYLMKACFNGVYRTNLAGKFNVPLGNRFYALPTPSELVEVSKILKQTELVCGDFEGTLRHARSGDFVYMDPPYSDASRFRGEYSYKGAFQSDAQKRLVESCRILDSKGVHVLLSFRACEDLIRSLAGWRVEKLEVRRSVAGFVSARVSSYEILASNY